MATLAATVATAAAATVAIACAVVAATVVVAHTVDLIVDAVETIVDTVVECYDVATSIVEAVESDVHISEEQTYDNSIYVLVDSKTNVRYVGITNDVKRRQNQHRYDPFHPWRKDYQMKVVATGLSRLAARLGEQVLISTYTLESLENARREIATGNLEKFVEEMGIIAELWKINEIPISLLR